MLKPKYLERLPDAIVELYSQVEQDILSDMAARVMAFDDFIPSAQWQYEKLIEMGNYHSYVVKVLAARMGKTEAEVARIMRESGTETLRFDDAIYRSSGLDPPPLAASPALQQVLSAGLKNTMGLFENLTATTANTATQQLERALDRAWLQVQSGAFSRQEAVRMAIKDLAASGIESVRYPSGHIDKLDVTVRRAILTGVNQTALKLQEARADEMGCDLVEVTAHAGARVGEGIADHAQWQGKVYSRSGKHRQYPSLAEKTGYGSGPGLGGWNCRHSFFPFIEGVSEPSYTDAELKELNAPMYEYNGRKMTEYEATKRQRYIERQIRRWKREKAAMKAAGLDTVESAAKAKHWQEVQKDFIRQTGLKRQYDRERVTMPARAAADAERNTGKTVVYDPKANFDIRINGYRESVQNGISEASRLVAEKGGADSCEHMILVDMKSGELAFHEKGSATEVGGRNFWDFVLSNEDRNFAFVHNHNTDGYFSEADMRTLLTTDNIKAFIAVRLDGVKYVAEKVRPAPNMYLFDDLYKDEIQSLTDKLKQGIITAGERARERERIIVDGLLRDYTKGLIEFDGRP